MALRFKKYPKKPKKSASTQTLKNWLNKVKDVDKHNAAIEKERNERNKLINQISGIGSAASRRRR